jgi:hypothetical protein
MDCACVLKDEVSTSVEELLIIGTVETIAVGADDGVWFGQLEAYGPRRTADGPPYVEEPDAPGCDLFPSALALPR